jgi:hypothetical protein
VACKIESSVILKSNLNLKAANTAMHATYMPCITVWHIPGHSRGTYACVVVMMWL